MDLLRIVLDNPELYGPIIGMNPADGAEKIRARLFSVMWMNYAALGYRMNVLSEEDLQNDFFPGMFSSDQTPGLVA